ncbi:MAG: type IV pilus secretin PilQ [Magnetococcales bacterium]|nr:type IV pilus secretin PilQ [Magnetococcales bacterium]
MTYRLLTVIALMALAGCVPPQTTPGSGEDDAPPPAVVSTSAVPSDKVAEAPTAAQPAAVAQRITRIETVETGQGSTVVIQADGPLPYELFPLDKPNRLLLVFPKQKLDPAIQPRTLNLSGLTGLFPMERPEGGVKLEIMLKGEPAHEVVEKTNGLEVTLFSATHSRDAQGVALQDVQVMSGEEGTRIHLLGNGDLPDPQIHRLKNPNRLVVDLFGATGAVKRSDLKINSPEINGIQVGNAPDKARLIIALSDGGVTFRQTREHGMPVILLSHGVMGKGGAPMLRNVEFTREGEQGVVKVDLGRSDIPLESAQDGSDLIVDLIGAKLPEHLQRRMEVSAFGGPVNAVDAYPHGGGSRLVVRMSSGNNLHDILQKGDQLLIKVKPPQTADAGRTTYTGERITLDFQDISVQNAIKLIAEVSDLNIITSDSVSGTLTMRLVDVPWDQALDLILEARGLGKVKQGNIIRVAPLAEIQSMAQVRLQTEQSAQQLEPLVTEMIPVSFADVNQIRTLLTEGDVQLGSRILSSRGTVAVDPRTTTLIIKDTVSNLAKIREMIQRLDKPIPQVLIEARIVEVDRVSQETLGINWGFNYRPNSQAAKWGLSSSVANASTVQQATADLGAARPQMATPANVNLKPAGTVGNIGFNLGTLSPMLDLGVELGALETFGKAKVISSPRVLTTNNQSASIQQGINQPYPTESSSGGTTYSFIQATLMLTVTPQITPNNYITLTVLASNNSLGTAPSGSPPPINTKQVNTKVLVKNGDTIVLGGIYQNSTNEDKTGVPALSEIPLFGWLFKNYATRTSQTELLIFITPRVVEPS